MSAARMVVCRRKCRATASNDPRGTGTPSVVGSLLPVAVHCDNWSVSRLLQGCEDCGNEVSCGKTICPADRSLMGRPVTSHLMTGGSFLADRTIGQAFGTLCRLSVYLSSSVCRL